MLRGLILVFIIFNLILCSLVFADKLPLPRFASIKFNEVNVRTGPARDCPIEWVFIKKGEPVEIIAEYEQWLKVRDINGEGGWAHSSVISGARYIIITAKNVMPLLNAPEKYEQIVAKVSPGLRCNLKKCQKNWCQVNCQNYQGWIARKYIWGVYPTENI